MKAHSALQAKGRFVAAMNEDVACPVCEGSGGSNCWSCTGTGQVQKKAWWKFGDSKTSADKPTPTELDNQLFQAVKNQDEDRMKELLSNGANCNIKLFDNAWTCLHEAATTGPATLVQSLISSGAALEARTEGKALTPLHVAALWQQPEAARTLILAGADKAAISAAGKMPRDYALGLGNTGLANLLSTERRYV